MSTTSKDLFWWRPNLFLSHSIFFLLFFFCFECYVLFGFVREAFQTQRVSNLALRNALICIKLLHIEILLSLPRFEDKQGFLFLIQKCVSCIIKRNTAACRDCITDRKNTEYHILRPFLWFCKALSFQQNKSKTVRGTLHQLIVRLLLRGLAAWGRPPRGAWSFRAWPNDTLLGDKAVGTLTPSLYKHLLNRHFFFSHIQGHSWSNPQR